ncbi:MAG: HU family DNA-binding protein [Opitutae bacterium]|nr:HU family DNA-binding protein [Opitutae bacterium]MCD8298989.1 HU family DNA-binding protein [Opitutae bacterium]
MNKGELIEKIKVALGGETSKACAERCLAAVLDSIKNGIKTDKTVQIIGFGTFTIANRAARQGVNPKTGEKIKIKASKSVKFKAGSALKQLAAKTK